MLHKYTPFLFQAHLAVISVHYMARRVSNIETTDRARVVMAGYGLTGCMYMSNIDIVDSGGCEGMNRIQDIMSDRYRFARVLSVVVFAMEGIVK